MFVRDNKKLGYSPYTLLENITEGLAFSVGANISLLSTVSRLTLGCTQPPMQPLHRDKGGQA
jgi:hypothetical protein